MKQLKLKPRAKTLTEILEDNKKRRKRIKEKQARAIVNNRSKRSSFLNIFGRVIRVSEQVILTDSGRKSIFHYEPYSYEKK